MVFIAFFARAFALPRSIVIVSWVSNTVLLAGWRWAALYLSQRRAEPKRALIYGAGELARLVKEQIESRISLSARYDLLGFVGREEVSDLGISPLLGTLQELEELIEREGIDEVIYSPDRSSAEELDELTERCKSAAVNTAITTELFELVTRELYLGYELDSLPLTNLDSLPARGWYLGFKRVFDLVVASLLLLLLAIPMGLIAPYSLLLCYLLEKIPFLCTHYLAVIRKAGIPHLRPRSRA